jgi:hypothetical protein
LSREQCAEQAFDPILALNKNRILGGLDSKHFKRPQYYRGSSRNSLTERLRGLISPTTLDKQKVNALSHDIDIVHDHFIRLETSKPEDVVEALKAIVQAAYTMTADGISLLARFRDTGLSTTDSREVREVGKVANYWRICRSFAHMTRS